MSSTPRGDSHFAHYICTGEYPLGANRLIIGIYFDRAASPPSPPPRRPPEAAGRYDWGCFIAASFYDRQNRVVWHKTVCLVALRTTTAIAVQEEADRAAVAGREWSTVGLRDGVDTLGLAAPRDWGEYYSRSGGSGESECLFFSLFFRPVVSVVLCGTVIHISP